LHSRPSGSPVGSYADDFRTPAGDTWYTFFNFSNNPLGLVNRKDYPSGNEIKPSGSWNSEIASIISNTPKVKIRIHNVYDKTTRQLKTYSETKFLTLLNGNYKLNVILTEDSIRTWQLKDSSFLGINIPDYPHRHVLRGSINGDFGEKITTAATTNAGTAFFKGYITTLPAGWNANRVHVVVFLFNAGTYEILNVAEAAVIE